MSFTDGGYSWQFPEDSVSDTAGIAFIVQQLMAQVYTVRLVKIAAVHPGQAPQGGGPPVAGTVDVQILVNQIDGATPPNSKPHGIVFGLPYLRLRFGGWEVSGDPAVGDIGLAAVCDRDISVVKATQAQGNPGSQRRFSIADGIYIGGILNGAATSWIWLKGDGTLNITDSKGNGVSTSSSGFLFTGNVKVNGTFEATQIQTDDQGLTVTGSISATGSVIAGKGGADQVNLQTHTTSGVTTGGGTSGAPTPGT